MFFTKFNFILSACFYLTLLGFTTSCKEGVKGGSIKKTFSGLAQIEARSPSSVYLQWSKDEKYTKYLVYSNFQEEALMERIFEDAIVTGLTSNTSYTFKVIGLDSENAIAGADKEMQVKTWPHFLGPISAEKDADENIVVEWSYDHPVEFYIYYSKNTPPTAESTNNWLTPDVITTELTHTFKTLDGSSNYHFVVHAKFSLTEYDRPTQSVSATTKSGFPTPTYFLGDISIGSLPFINVSPIINGLYLETNYTSVIKKDGVAASDPLIGAGTLIFSNSINLEPGKVENISLEVTYDDGDATNETFTVQGLSTYIKGQPNFIDAPPVTSTFGGKAFFGESMAAGDFNCDGYEDLAVGMPKVSVASLGVKEPSAGAVIVYYTYRKQNGTYELNTNGAPALEPATPGKDPQIITFDDLNFFNEFGFSMDSGGNINGDRLGLNPCEDLIVGAPNDNSGNRKGAAYLFFGGRNGLSRPSHIADFPANIETCDGLVEEATCSAVKLWPDHSIWPASTIGGTYQANAFDSSRDRFGYSVSFIGDINSDGFDDIAIGAPYGDWDGEAQPGAPASSGYVRDVGYVALFFGSRYGVGSETPNAAGIPSGGDDKFRWIKVYPPFAEGGMRFGASIAGRADVDGYYPVYNANGKYYGGSDFIIGAPGFSYRDPYTNLVQMDGSEGLFPTNGGWTKAPGIGLNYSDPTNAWNISQGNADTGIAFLYFGRGNASNPGVNIDKPFRQGYWNCSNRGMTSNIKHYSCLTSSSNFRVIFPRLNNATNFGSSVALIGDPSRYDDANNLLATFSDANQDGYAETIVAASYGDGANADTGHIWQYFGNKSRYYEGGDFNGIAIDGDATASGEFRDNDPACVNFNSPALVTSKQNCAPTVIRPNSVLAGAHMGLTNESLISADITGDGVKDLIVGAPYDSTKGSKSGAIYSFISSPGIGLTTVYKKIYDNSGDLEDKLGYSVAVGNFDGDFDAQGVPLNDIATGVPGDETKNPGSGAAQVFLSNGLTLPAIKQISDIKLYENVSSIQDYGHYKTTLVGDINGDGYDDAVSRMSDFDDNGSEKISAVIFYGSPIGLITTTYCSNSLTRVFKTGMENVSECFPALSHLNGITNQGIILPQHIAKPNNMTGQWAQDGYPAGDINGDGFSDVAFVEMGRSVIIYYGTAGGLQAIANPKWNPDINDPQIITYSFVPTRQSRINGSNCASCADTLATSIPIQSGDLNNDGFSDLVITNPDADSPAMNIAVANVPHADLNTLGVNAGEGWLCDPAPTDGSCETGRGISDHGIVFIVYGSATGAQTPSAHGQSPGTDFSTTNTDRALSIYDSEANGAQRACTPGENKVCKGQFIRNPVFVNVNYGYHELSHGFGTGFVVMDYNNDGIDDLLVGAPGFEDINCLSVRDTASASYKRNYGRIYIYEGSDQGLIAAQETDYYMAYNGAASCPSALLDPAFDDKALGTQALGNVKTRALMPQIAYESTDDNKTNRRFGSFMTVAGDLNGDGAEDLLVTTPNESPTSVDNPGVGYVYYGPICGADNEPSLLALTQLSGNLNKQYQWTNPSDLSTLSSINFASDCQLTSGPKLPMQKFMILPTAEDTFYGTGLLGMRKGKGDMNKDGFDDILISSYHWDDNTTSKTNVGRGIVYFGSQKGLFTNDFPNLTVVKNEDNLFKPYSLVPRIQKNDIYFFQFNPSGGDVNGDGSLDYIIPTYHYDGEEGLKGINIGGFLMFY